MPQISRRLTTLCLLMLVASTQGRADTIELVDGKTAGGVNSHDASNRAPLKPNFLIRLPLGSVAPEGWLAHQLELMADGQVGHLEEISRFLQKDSGWLGGDERGWEEAAYWFRGFYDLARLTGDPRLIARADYWMETIIQSQKEDGYYGSTYNRLIQGKDGQEIVDVWPHMVMNDALISHYESTGDDRIISMLTRFFAFCRDLPDEQFLPPMSWDYYENYSEHFGDWKPRIQMKRAGDMVPQILWLYNHTGDAWLIDLAVEVYHRTQPAMNQWLDNHTVHFAQRFRYPAQMVSITGDQRYLRKTELFYDTFKNAWGQMPRGAHAADERIRMGKIDARQAIETCAIAELNKSHIILGQITGDTVYADRVEDMTFNHLPVSHAPDHRSLRYLTACNMAYSVPRMDFKNTGNNPVFAADWHRCCQHNTAMAWPGFVRNLWQASADNGLVAWMYSPNTVTARVGSAGIPISIDCETGYPFHDQVVMTVQTERDVTFPLYLRVPGWCDGLQLSVPGEQRQIDGQAGKLVCIRRLWQDSDRIELRFGMQVTATQWPRNGAVTIDRGPLSYSVRIKQRWEQDPTSPEGWPRWSVWPDSTWNYGLAIDPDAPDAAIEVEVAQAVSLQPWTEPDSPVVLRVPAKQIPDWGAAIKHTVDAVREGPVKSDAPLETIEMIPMGCAHLRMTVLPVISDRRDARQWKDIPNPDTFMLDRLDK